MNVQEIETRLNEIGEILIAKGYERPNGYVQIGGRFSHYHAHNPLTNGSVDQGVFGDDYDASLNGLKAWAEEVGEVADQRKREAVEKFGQAVDALREAGFEADFVDPLAGHLQAMTDNLLTDQRP